MDEDGPVCEEGQGGPRPLSRALPGEGLACEPGAVGTAGRTGLDGDLSSQLPSFLET